MTKGKTKGTSFERDICKQLSLWWSNGKTDDIFWRTASSGGRATQRSKQKASTFGQYGDVQATDPQGQPLIDLCTIEIKVGYSRQTIFDLVDKLPTETQQTYKKFIQQAKQDNANSDSHYWILITKRRYKETLIIMPTNLYLQLKMNGSHIAKAKPAFQFMLDGERKGSIWKLYGTTLTQFFKHTRPKEIKDLIN